MTFSTDKREEGMALLLAVAFLIVMGMLVAFTTSRVLDYHRHVASHEDYQHSYAGVDSAAAEVRVEATALASQTFVGFTAMGASDDGLIGLPFGYDLSGFDPADVSTFPAFNDPGVTPISISSQPGTQYIGFTFDLGTDLNGAGPLRVDRYLSTYTISQVVRNGEVKATRRTEEIFMASDVSVWNNTIFAGGGQAGGVINGNVSIHGSVHLLGDNLGGGVVALAALDLSGTSLIHNNYEGLSADLRSRIPALPTTMHAGELVETLGAELRVKNGLVGMSGSSEVGEAQIAGNAYKETMDGVFVEDGWTGTDLDGDGNPQSVYSDNGWSNGYDLSDSVHLPTINEEVDAGVSYRDYFLETDSDPTVGFQQEYTGDITLTSGGDNFFFSSTTGISVANEAPGVNGMPTQADLATMTANGEFFLWYDGSTHMIVTNGRVGVDGNFNLLSGNGAANKIFNYEGTGTILAYDDDLSGDGGDITVDASMKTAVFPANVMGLMAEDDMFVGNSAQLEVMGGFYAQDTISIDRQTTFLGTVVAENFDMGGQVPDIFQVPGLPGAWSPELRMIGSTPVIFLQTVSWREYGAS